LATVRLNADASREAAVNSNAVWRSFGRVMFRQLQIETKYHDLAAKGYVRAAGKLGSSKEKGGIQ